METLNQIVARYDISKVDLAANNSISRQRLNGWLNLAATVDDYARIHLFQKVEGLFFDEDLFDVNAKYKRFKTINIPLEEL